MQESTNESAKETYRVLFPITLYATGQTYHTGDIVDLSHLSDERIKELCQRGIIETADGEPVNTQVVNVRAKKPGRK